MIEDDATSVGWQQWIDNGQLIQQAAQSSGFFMYGASWQDFNLSVAGSRLGAEINAGTVNPSEVGDYMRRNWSASGPGTYGLSGLLNTYLPLPSADVP